MKKVGEGTIPMVYSLWKELKDSVDEAEKRLEFDSGILSVHKQILDRLEEICQDKNDEELIQARMRHVILVAEHDKLRQMVVDLTERFNKYYSFEP